jgi:prophage antirepressor-like protein
VEIQVQERIFIMNNLQVISHPQFGMFSYIIIDGKEMFKATECAKMLGYSNPQEAIRTHCKGVSEILTPTKGGKQKVKMIYECDLWRLIIHSKLPTAEKIEKWIMEDVLPSIRKTGSYSVEQNPEPQYEQLKLEEKPYEYFDKFYNGVLVLSVEDVSKLIGQKRAAIDFRLNSKLFKTGADYFFLTNESLAEFKQKNPKIVRSIPHMNIITKSGFDKLCKIYGVKVEMPKAIEKKNTVPKKNSKDESTNECIITLGVLSDVRNTLSKSNNLEAVEQISNAIKYVAWELSARAIGLT